MKGRSGREYVLFLKSPYISKVTLLTWLFPGPTTIAGSCVVIHAIGRMMLHAQSDVMRSQVIIQHSAKLYIVVDDQNAFHSPLSIHSIDFQSNSSAGFHA
jgi:hypothetical protein